MEIIYFLTPAAIIGSVLGSIVKLSTVSVALSNDTVSHIRVLEFHVYVPESATGLVPMLSGMKSHVYVPEFHVYVPESSVYVLGIIYTSDTAVSVLLGMVLRLVDVGVVSAPPQPTREIVIKTATGTANIFLMVYPFILIESLRIISCCCYRAFTSTL